MKLFKNWENRVFMKFLIGKLGNIKFSNSFDKFPMPDALIQNPESP
jgi:hypothetical protein